MVSAQRLGEPGGGTSTEADEVGGARLYDRIARGGHDVLGDMHRGLVEDLHLPSLEPGEQLVEVATAGGGEHQNPGVGRDERFELVEIPDTDHIFRRKTPDLEEAVHAWARAAVEAPA